MINPSEIVLPYFVIYCVVYLIILTISWQNVPSREECQAKLNTLISTGTRLSCNFTQKEGPTNFTQKEGPTNFE